MKKIAIDNLTVEITRRCQLQCAHCLRGDAQNIDISKKYIDKLLESVCSIGRLLFSGGEPTMNIDAMSYFLEKIKAKNISLNKLFIITNGYVVSDEFINLIKEYYSYITYDKDYGEHAVVIDISDDRYHKQCGYNPEESYHKYVAAFEGIPMIKVFKYDFGNFPDAIGRGKQLKEAMPSNHESMPLRKIEVMSEGTHNYCPSRKNFQMMDGIDAVIMCPIFLSVDGRISHTLSVSEFEYAEMDKIGAYIDEGLLEAINEYNKTAEWCMEISII